MQEQSDGTSPPRSPGYSAENARGGEIVLHRPWQRAVFIFGLAAPFVILVLLLLLWR
jgi:hypothetical protein